MYESHLPLWTHSWESTQFQNFHRIFQVYSLFGEFRNIRNRISLKSLFSYIFSFHFQSISEFLKNLPCHNEQNFALYNTENGIRTSSRRPSVYLPTVDIPSEQSMCDFDVFLDKKKIYTCHFTCMTATDTYFFRYEIIFLFFTFSFSHAVIVTEKKNILLRYLHQQWDKKVSREKWKKNYQCQQNIRLRIQIRI